METEPAAGVSRLHDRYEHREVGSTCKSQLDTLGRQRQTIVNAEAITSLLVMSGPA